MNSINKCVTHCFYFWIIDFCCFFLFRQLLFQFYFLIHENWVNENLGRGSKFRIFSANFKGVTVITETSITLNTARWWRRFYRELEPDWSRYFLSCYQKQICSTNQCYKISAWSQDATPPCANLSISVHLFLSLFIHQYLSTWCNC